MPPTNPEVWLSTWNVCDSCDIEPESMATKLFADVRSAAEMPGSCAAVSATPAGAAELSPNVTLGNRFPKLYAFTRTCCRPPPNCSAWFPAVKFAVSLYWYVRVLRPCGWNVTSGEPNDDMPGTFRMVPLLKSTSLLKSTGARLPPMRTSLRNLDEPAHRQEPTYRWLCASVNTSGVGSETWSMSVRSSSSKM